MPCQDFKRIKMDTSEGMSSRCLDLLDQRVLRELDEAAVARDERLQRVALGAWLRYQMETEGFGPSPLDLHPKHSSPLPLPPLCWYNYGLEPSLIKVTNTGSTVIVNARWDSERPYLLGGPFRGRYVFSQIHFHWGPDNGSGAEHSLMGQSFPLEMHVAHYKAAYENQERALREADGIAIVGYVFKLKSEDNTELNPILRALPNVKEPRTSHDLPLVSLASLGVRKFEDDYFFYYGSVEVSEQQCPVMWIIWPNPLRISSSQVCLFRDIFSRTGEVHAKNFRTPRPAEDGKNVHFVYGGPIIPDLSKAGRRNRRRSKRDSRREDSFPLVDNEKKETD
ncbi:carbonic anhydrase 2-like [Ischnura elegans]|uniref:carbonic anhydrase 2-like n=1 Tax=Ischnura elegans TaxID=197161 RepID=UPI001ED89ECA|nr:carbonic anhydrase 2-like [Ischnura elegans]